MDQNPSHPLRVKELQSRSRYPHSLSIEACPHCGQRFQHERDIFEHANICNESPIELKLKWDSPCLDTAESNNGKFSGFSLGDGPALSSLQTAIVGSESYLHLNYPQSQWAARTPAEVTAAQIGQLSIRQSDGVPITPHSTPRTRKRPATSDIKLQAGASNSPDGFGAKPTPRSGSNCVKRLACGSVTPFPRISEAPTVTHVEIRKKELSNQRVYHKSRHEVTPESRCSQIDSKLIPESRETTNLRPRCSQSERSSGIPPVVHGPGIYLQPEPWPIKSEQLSIEVRNIYNDLFKVEAKCISIDNAELAIDRTKIDSSERDKWQASIALHRTLLYEHHDFLSASQHPIANDSLRNLALKYSMPARMWKHAIHSFLEILRRRLPDSMDYMLQFIYTAYQMIALLYETIEAFKPTWIECLGDLARYRMAIEDGLQRDRETWGAVARSWYSMASDISPKTGRIYHHLGILARPNVVKQLSFYCRSVTCVQPFPNARESLSALLRSAPESRYASRASSHRHEVDAMFLHLHAVMYLGLENEGSSNSSGEDFDDVQEIYVVRLADQMNELGAKWKEHGVHIAVSNISACFDYGRRQSTNLLCVAFGDVAAEPATTGSDLRHSRSLRALLRPASLLFSVFGAVLQCKADFKVLPHVHVLLVFIRSVSIIAARTVTCVKAFLQLVPWSDLILFLNSFARMEPINQDIVRGNPLKSFQAGSAAPLPEDYSLRGEVWSEDYFAEGWFEGSPDEDTRYLEQASTDKRRAQRVLWLGISISKHVDYYLFNEDSRHFCISDECSVLSTACTTQLTEMEQQAQLNEETNHELQVKAKQK